MDLLNILFNYASLASWHNLTLVVIPESLVGTVYCKLVLNHVENNSLLAWVVNNEHRKFSLKCIICNLSSYSKLKLFTNYFSLLVRFRGRGQTVNYYYLKKMKLEIKPIYSSHFIHV